MQKIIWKRKVGKTKVQKKKGVENVHSVRTRFFLRNVILVIKNIIENLITLSEKKN